MNRDFFIRLTFAAHRVADALPKTEQVAQEIRSAANEILADLLLLTSKEVMKSERKREILFQLERQIDILLVYFDKAKKQNLIHPENFSLLEVEYGKIRELFEIFRDIQEPKIENIEEEKSELLKKEGMVMRETPKFEKQEGGEKREEERVLSQVGVESNPHPLTQRQKKIIEFLRAKENAQVWELQKILPEVTKRTLRRDLDELLQKNLVERKGAWNSAPYELKT